MRVSLVQCPAWGALPPLGLASLKAYLVPLGHQVRCFDLNIDLYRSLHPEDDGSLQVGVYGGVDPWGPESYDLWAVGGWFEHAGERPALPLDRWADEVLADDPDVVGFTAYFTSLMPSLDLAEVLRRRKPELIIVLGGPEVSRDQEGDTALAMGIADLVVDGEGEATFAAVLDALESGRPLHEVAGIGLLVDGRIRWTAGRPLLPKVDELPIPDFSDADWERYPNPYLVPIMASRGCVLQCAFCYETVYWKRFRTQGAERIVAEIEAQIARHPLREQAIAEGERFYFMFADSLVNGHLGGLRRMAELLVDRGVDIGWGGQATINTKMDEEFFALLARSGCTGLAFGLESGSQGVLDDMGKRFQISDATDFLRRVHDAGVTATVNVMVGFPTETRRDFLDTLRFLVRSRRYIFQVSNVTTTGLARGSALDRSPERFGVELQPDGTWRSAATGTERDRLRRLRLLHLWMRAWRIPHQQMAG